MRIEHDEGILVMWDAAHAQIGLLEYFELRDGSAYIRSFKVDEECRGRGIGTQLIQHLMSLYPHITLHVNTSNKKAQRLYERLGFVYVHTTGRERFAPIRKMEWHAD